MLRTLLRIALQLLREDLVLGRRGAARPRPCDGVRREAVTLDLQKELGRRADDLEGRRSHEEEIRARVHPAQRSVQGNTVERPSVGERRHVDRLAPSQDDLDGFACRDGVLGDLDGTDVGLASQARVDSFRGQADPAPGCRARASTGPARGLRAGPVRHLGCRRPGSSLQRLEDRPLGDAIAALEIRRRRVQRGDRGEIVGQVIEHQDQVGLDERRGGNTDRVAFRERDGRLEGGDGVVGERAHCSARESRHAVARLDPPPRDEPTQGVQRVGRLEGLGRQRRVVLVDRHGPRLDRRRRPTDLEQPPRDDAQERVAAQALAAFDRLEEVGRTAIVEAQKRPDRRLEVGRAARLEEQRVRVGGQALRGSEAERICRCHRRWPSGLVRRSGADARETKRPFVPGTKGRAFRGATLIRRCRTHVTDGSTRDAILRRRSALPSIAGALRRSLLARRRRAFGPEAPGSIPCRCRPGFHQPPGLCADARRVLVPFIALFRCGGESRRGS